MTCLDIANRPKRDTRRVELWFFDRSSNHQAVPRIVVVQRDLQAVDEIAAASIEAWIEGPTRAERKAGAAALANPHTRLLGLDVDRHVARVDVSHAFHKTGLGTTSEGLVLDALVGVLTQFSGIKRVMLYTNGSKNQVWGGHGGILDPKGEERVTHRWYRRADVC